jgi:hypothetical protein
VAEVLVVAAIAAVGWVIRGLIARGQREAAVLSVMQTFAPGQAAVQQDPKQLLVWYPLAEASRKLYPAAFATLDEATGARFPFSREAVERAHAKVTSEWLAWEAAHDEEYRIKAAAAEHDLSAATAGEAALRRARLDRIQHEKIERYQQRYEEYARTAKALQALLQ